MKYMMVSLPWGTSITGLWLPWGTATTTQGCNLSLAVACHAQLQGDHIIPQTGMSEWIANDLLHMQYPFKLTNSLTHCLK
jgi:hypothetical protein